MLVLVLDTEYDTKEVNEQVAAQEHHPRLVFLWPKTLKALMGARRVATHTDMARLTRFLVSQQTVSRILRARWPVMVTWTVARDLATALLLPMEVLLMDKPKITVNDVEMPADWLAWLRRLAQTAPEQQRVILRAIDAMLEPTHDTEQNQG